MKRLMNAALGLSLLVPAASFAQDTGGCKGRKSPTTELETGKKPGKVETKTRRGGKKGQKGGKIEDPNAGNTPKTTSVSPKTTSKDPKSIQD